MGALINKVNTNTTGPKMKFFTLSFFFLGLSLIILISTLRLTSLVSVLDYGYIEVSVSHINNNNSVHEKKEFSPLILNFLKKELLGHNKEIKVGLINMNENYGYDHEYWNSLGETVLISFDRVTNELKWEDLFLEWIDEEEKYGYPPKCPEIPMPSFEKFPQEFDVVISRIPCGNDQNDHTKLGHNGVRDLFRLQVNLVVANLVARRSSSSSSSRSRVYVVFIGSCEPMLEIFRCDDLVKHEDDFWIYKPNLKRLKQKLLMPYGSCQLATPFLLGNYIFIYFLYI